MKEELDEESRHALLIPSICVFFANSEINSYLCKPIKSLWENYDGLKGRILRWK